jgi:hypothetical protein
MLSQTFSFAVNVNGPKHICFGVNYTVSNYIKVVDDGTTNLQSKTWNVHSLGIIKKITDRNYVTLVFLSKTRINTLEISIYHHKNPILIVF